MKAVVIGLGQFGSAAAVALKRAGVETIAMDRDMGPVDRLKDRVDLAVCADATSPESLEAHWVGDADVLVAGIGEDFEAQVLVVVQAKRAGVRHVVARAASEVHQRVLEAVGADLVINPEREAAEDIVLRLLAPKSGKTTRVAEGLCIVEIAAPGRATGRTQRDHGLDVLDRFGVRLIGLRRGTGPRGETLLDPDTRIESGDALFYAGSEASLVKLQGGG